VLNTHFSHKSLQIVPSLVIFAPWKKTQKTPSKEIDKALEIKKMYFKNKRNGK
jgi:hypothetical protein